MGLCFDLSMHTQAAITEVTISLKTTPINEVVSYDLYKCPHQFTENLWNAQSLHLSFAKLAGTCMFEK